jgi:hypothetical protein
VDSRGPRIPLACSFVCLLGGYSGIRYFYDSGLAPDALSVPAIIFYALLLCSFLTGVGSSGGGTSSIYSTAKTFPDRAVCILLTFFLLKIISLITPWQRASATGLVISGYGLSAFLFSTISHIFFADRASPLLLVLSLGSSFPMILGFFFVRPVPLPEEELNRDVYSETNSSGYEQLNSSYIPLLDSHINGQDDNDDTRVEVELSPTLRSQNCETSGRNLSRGAAKVPDMLPNVHGMKLWCSGDFWLLSGIVAIRMFPLLIYNLCSSL